MKKSLLFCLFIAPLMVCAAADNNNSPSNQRSAQMLFFHGKRALEKGNFEDAKSFFQQSANLGYPSAIEILADLQQVFANYNQPERRTFTVERAKK